MAFVLGAGLPAAAKPTPAQKCTGAKMKAAAKKVTAKLACYAKAASKTLPVDDACLSKAETTFTTAFSKAESKGGCVTVGDAGAVEATIDSFVQSEATAIPPGETKDAGKCASSKLKAAGTKAMGKLLCNAKAATKNIPVDPDCLGKAGANLMKAFAKAEKKGGCVTTGDAGDGGAGRRRAGRPGGRTAHLGRLAHHHDDHGRHHDHRCGAEHDNDHGVGAEQHDLDDDGADNAHGHGRAQQQFHLRSRDAPDSRG